MVQKTSAKKEQIETPTLIEPARDWSAFVFIAHRMRAR
jgi:hypothetical protein